MASEAEIRNGALRMLGVIDIGDDASTDAPDDDTYMTQKYSEVYAALKKEGMAYWASGGAIPDEYSPHVQALCAFFSTDDYSISSERLQRIQGKTRVAWREIRKLGTPQHESTDKPKDY